ncbi:WD-40 repeat-containing protein [Rhizobium sp. CF080]|uniref:nSTAND1 domain-containing NTPase n=1 Tax=Rhizobium sp. (strain CF080) TaxID=1144310 RepID=UPI0003E7EB79|nr:caspase family protein [Rhizobium sp. CF080]EUB98257.1 WD-40 repeat-containing protein [Rhizobium sp. CF080]
MDGFDRSLAFLVAIDRYENNIPDLKTPVADATKLAYVLETLHGFETEILSNEKAGKTALETYLDELQWRVGPDDRVVFYFAGHGIAYDSDHGARGFILPHDARKDGDASKSFISMESLHQRLAAMRCRHLLVVLDCCFAGAFRWSGVRTTLALATEKLHRDRYRWFIEDRAWQAIASAAHDQEAIDVAAHRALGRRDTEADHSPFALALIEGLEGAADRPGLDGQADGVITATELFQYVEERMLISAQGGRPRQTPILWLLEKHDKGQFVFLTEGRSPDDLPRAPELDEQANPWRAFESYDEQHSSLFFGRRAVSDALTARLLGSTPPDPEAAIGAERFIVVAGPSGIGKSSLVKAGLLPRLPKDKARSVTMRPSRPGPDAFASLATVLGAENIDEEVAPDAKALRENPQALADWIAKQKKRGALVLVVDQLEELITGAGDEDLPDAFLSMIEATLSSTGDEFRVVFTVRPELEPQFLLSALKARWNRARFPVPQMTREDLRRVVEGPAAQRTMRFSSDILVDALVDDVAGMPGGLPLLSFALSQMYRNYLRRRRSGTDRMLTEADYFSLLDEETVNPEELKVRRGGVVAALRIRANQIISDGDAQYQLMARRIFERLVSSDKGEFTRRRALSWEFQVNDPGEQASLDRLLDRLVNERLIVVDANVPVGSDTETDVSDTTSTIKYELAHDAMIHVWKELSDWVRADASRIADLRDFSSDAIDWHCNTRPVALWDDRVQVARIEALRGAATPGLNSVEIEFADASLRQAVKNERTRKAAIAGLIVLAVAASVAAWQFLNQRNAALRQESSLLARAAHEATQENWPDRGLWLSLHGLPRSGGLLGLLERPAEPAALARLSEALSRLGKRQLIISRQEQDIKGALLFPDGRVLVLLENSTLLIDASSSRSNSRVIAQFGSSTAAISLDGRSIALTHGNDASVVDLDSGKVSATLRGHQGPIWSLAFSPHGDRIVSGSYDQTARIWNAATGDQIALLAGHKQPVRDVAFSDNGDKILTIADDRTAVVWRANDGSPIRILSHGEEVVRAALFLLDGKTVVSASSGGLIWVWNTESDAPPRRLPIHEEDITAIDLSPDGTRLAIASTDGTAKVLDIENGQVIADLKHEQFAALVSIVPGPPIVRSAVFSEDGQRVVTAIEGRIRLWDAIGGDLKQEINLNPDRYSMPITTASFSAAGRHLLVRTDSSVFLLDPLSNAERLTLRGQGSSVLAAAYSPNGRVLVTGYENFDAIAWDTISGKKLFSLGKEAGSCFSIVFSPAGDRFATASFDRIARYWDAETGQLVATFPHDGLTLKRVDISPDGTMLLTTGGNKVKIWKIKSQELMKAIPLPGGTEVLDANFSPDSKRIVTASGDGVARIFSTAGLELVATQQRSAKFVTANFSPDGTTILMAGADHNAYLWRADNGSMIRSLEGHTSELTHALFSPDGAKIVTSSMDETARIWNAATGELLAELRGQAGELGFATFSPDGSMIITAARYGNGVAHIWDARTGAEITSLIGHRQSINRLDFSPDGASIVTASSDGTARVWKAPHSIDNAAALIQAACNALSLAGRKFELEEAADIGARTSSDGPCR